MLWTRSLLARLLVPYLLVLGAVALGLYLYGEAAVRRLYLDTVSAATLRQARLAGELLPWNLSGPALDARCAALRRVIEARISVIAPDGTVVGDSDKPSGVLENHRDRPEISAAWLRGEGSDVRVSRSVHVALFYRAWRQVRGGEQRVVRLALPLAEIERTLYRIRSALWGGVGVAALAALIPALLISRRVARRISRLTEFSHAVKQGTPPPPFVPIGDDVVGRLEANMVSMADTLGAQLQAAREEREKLEAVLRGMVEGVLVVDKEGTIQLANRRVQQIFGLPSEATLVGRYLIDVSRDPDLQELWRAVREEDAGQPHVRQITLAGAAQEFLQVTATAIGKSRPQQQTFIFVFHDVTELRKLEVTRRDFVANVSHELKTPLTAIRGYAETLRAGTVGDEKTAGKFIDVIQRNAERLGRLIEDLLTLSDIELGRKPPHRQLVALAPVVEAALDVARGAAERREVKLRTAVSPDLPPVPVDSDQLEQVLVNLIDNAVKYSQTGGEVIVSARSVPSPQKGAQLVPVGGAKQGAWLELCVADTGIGIPSRDLPRLTERFYRVDKARSRELGGTGLGLAIVKHIVQAHGGILRIESQLGCGTSVYVYLPRAVGVGDAAPPQ